MNEANENDQAEERLDASPDVVAVTVEDEVVAFDMAAGRYYGLRGSAGLIWDKIAAGIDRQSAIVAQITASHSGDAEHIRADVAKAIAEMKQIGVLVTR